MRAKSKPWTISSSGASWVLTIDSSTSEHEATQRSKIRLSAPPSGRVSVEHVINVLARLNAAPRPANVETPLQVLTPPIADTARYDRLRDLSSIGEAGHA